METLYKVNVVRGQLAFTVESHDKAWVEARAKEYLQMQAKWLNEVPSEPESRPRQPPSKLGHRGSMSPNEFYRAYIHGKITSRPDIATFFVYYLEKIQKKTTVTSGDVRDMFRQAQYSGWNKVNVPDALLKAKKKAFLNSVGNKWSLSISGEDYVLNNLKK